MDLEDSIPGERKGPQATVYPGMVKRPLCQRRVWGHGNSGGLIRTWAFARMGESYWRFRAELVTVWDLSFTGSPPQAAELRLE